MGSFQAHVGLLRLFLTRREQIAESIEVLLNAQRKPARYLQDRPLLSRYFEDCFYSRNRVTASQTCLRGQLEEAHHAAGFRPRAVDYLHNDLVHPAEMMVRAFHFWRQTHWPGRNGRMLYAHTLFNLYVIRCLAFLSLRLWDQDPGSARERLGELQEVLNVLRESSPASQPVFVRDARWLIPLAQSLVTDDLAPYFEVARHVTETLPEADRVEIRKAHVRMLGGHLTSQIRYYCAKDGVPVSDPSIVVRTRTSNALDFALLVQGLVELLHAYERALLNGDERMRLDMAGAICQGVSADPELFLNRLDLLRAYSMMEHVFITADSAGHAAYSPEGLRHVQLLREYGTLMDRLIPALREDFPQFRPVAGSYSTYGAVLGIPCSLLELLALKSLQRDAETRFGLEDVFADGDSGDGAKLAWVDGWRKMPHISLELQRLYEYPQQLAEDIYNRIARELNRESAASEKKTGRLYITPETDPNAASIPDLPADYFASSDRAQLLRDRQEGHFLLSYETPGGWVAFRKELLTEVCGEGRDARIAGLPAGAAQVLRLMSGAIATSAADPAKQPA